MMKKFLILTILFFCFQSALAQEVETRYYNAGQTQAEVRSRFQEFAQEYAKNGFQVTVTEKVNDNDYTQEFVMKGKNDLTSVFLIRYQFFADKVVCTILKVYVVNTKNEVFPVTLDNKNDDLKKYYFLQKNNFVDSIFDYLKIHNNKEPLRKAG